MVSCAVPPTAYSTSRLLEGEVRAASMTFSAPGTRLRTQASNFSRRRRSTAPNDTITVSMPNWRKHSVSRFLADSFRSTRATRAVAFLPEGASARAVPNAFSMTGADYRRKFIVARLAADGKTLRDRWGGQKCHYLGWTGE